MTIALTVNGKAASVTAEPDTPLLWVLREHLKLTGTKFGCGSGLCGACTVHIDGKAVRSCQIARLAGAGQEDHDDRRPVGQQRAIRCRRRGSPSRCRNAATASPGRSCRRRSCWPPPRTPTREQIVAHMDGNICRCGTYPRIVRAIERAAREA